jgi:endonuclease/exonuclease/phosphatase family metal-dependent hydrolase
VYGTTQVCSNTSVLECQKSRFFMMSRGVIRWALCIIVAGCASASINYTDPLGPRYAGGAVSDTSDRGALRVVSFNVHYAKQMDSVVALLRSSKALRGVDVLLMQEMDEVAARKVADSLGMHYVFYPATLHPATKRDFGNAILSRYRLTDDRKVVLPHLARFRNTARIAVGATIHVGGRPVRVYSVHIATVVNNGPGARRKQVEALLDDADGSPTVIIGGDFNSSGAPEVALARGYDWPTRRIGRTMALWSLDHVLLKGAQPVAPDQMGTVKDTRGASDHRPVWIHVSLAPASGN